MHIWQQHRTTLFFLLALTLLSILVHFGRIGASIDGVDLSTDAANYATMAAANTHPDAFVHDPAYNDKDRYGVHDTAVTALFPALTHDNNYGLAYLQLTGIQFFLHGLAFYFLGLFLLRKPWQAIFFSLIMSQAYWLTFGTYWGNGYYDYLPRSTFEIFYAFFIIAALRLRNSPRLWPLFMIGIGLTAYIHSISTLPTALGFWLGFVLCRPQETPWTKHLLWLVFCGLCFIATISPIVLGFVGHGTALSQDDVHFMRRIVALRYNIEFTHYWVGLKDYIVLYTLAPLFPLGIAGYVCIQKWADAKTQAQANQFACWALGVLFCLALFILDQEMGRILERKPLEFDLVRVVRFWIFLAICLLFMGANVLYAKCQKHKKRWLSLHIILFMVLFASGAPQKLLVSLPWYWNQGESLRYENAYAPALQRHAILKAVQTHTHKGQLIFDPHGDRAIRYWALRGLVYSWQDCSIYYYAKDLPGLRTWYTLQEQLKTAPTAYMRLAKEHKADYLISHRPEDIKELEQIGDIVWKNSQALLIRLYK